MRTEHHLLISLLGALPFIYIGNYIGALVFVAVGVFVDVDHLVDYYYTFGQVTLNPKKLASRLERKERRGQLSKYFCPLHAWELAAALSLLSFVHPWCIAAAMSLVLHLFMDAWGNHTSLFTFFLALRVVRGFRRN